MPLNFDGADKRTKATTEESVEEQDTSLVMAASLRTLSVSAEDDDYSPQETDHSDPDLRHQDTSQSSSTDSDTHHHSPLALPGTSIGTHTNIDLSHLNLDVIPTHYVNSTSAYQPKAVRSLSLHHNRIVQLLQPLSVFSGLIALDLSNNSLVEIPETICHLRKLRVLLIKSNSLDSDSFPKSFNRLDKLEVLNLSGNVLEYLPDPIFSLSSLKALYIGGNRLRDISCRLGNMTTLELLYLGGNRLRDVPATIGKLRNLTSLVLCDNRLETIPSTIAELQRLENLSLHNNQLKTLPTEIVKLQNMQQLSLRSNPLVARFVRDMTFDPPSLMELAGRVVKMKKQQYQELVPKTVTQYLDTAHHCVNPKCKGVYFEARVEHVKFVDFCGKYRVPLLQYLCSPKCSIAPAYAITESSAASGSESEPELDAAIPASKLKKILLG